MYKITGAIEGVAPILFNGWSDEAVDALDRSVTGGKRSQAEREDEALAKVYRNAQGLYLPFRCFKASLLGGAKMAKLKEGKGSVVPYFQATIFADNTELPFGVDKPDFTHRVVGRIPPGPKGHAALIRRPALNPGWRVPFELTVLDDRRNADQIRTALDTAGMFVGLCDWRPEYGRFLVKEWNLVK